MFSKFGRVGATLRCAGLALAALAPLAAVQAQSNYATPYTFRSLAGIVGSPGALDATGSAARFSDPCGVARDGAGNFYIADTNNQTIRKITSGGVVTTLAGTPGMDGSTDGTGAAARFADPRGIAVDGAGNVYVADTSNYTIRKITAGGVVTTLAGTAGAYGSADGTGAAAQFVNPSGVAVDGAGNVYVADTANETIRKITPAGVVTTFAGTAGGYGFTDGTGAAAKFADPRGVAVDGAGNVYVADTFNNAIRMITPGGVVTTLAGNGGYGSADGTGSAAQFGDPGAVAVDGAGNVWVADTQNGTIRLIAPGGIVTTLAGTAGIFGAADGTGAAAQFYYSYGVAVDGSGNAYVADTLNSTIRKVTSGGVVTTFAGTAPYGSADGTGGSAAFYFPYGAAVDAAGTVYVTDTFNHTIRKISVAGVVTTFAGTAGVIGSADGTGSAAAFHDPYGLAVDGAGNVYVADTGNDTIRMITPAGMVTTLAGAAGVPGSANGTGAVARFRDPTAVAVDGAGNVYVADTTNQLIRKITAGGVVTTLAGTAGSFGSADGTGSAARFDQPWGIAVDGAGNVYVADTYNHTVRKITSAAVVTTLAGTAGVTGSADGVGAAAQFIYPYGVAVDGAGNVYVSDTGNSTIRKISPTRVVTTLAGEAGGAGEAEGTGSAARFDTPIGIAVDSAGNVYVADENNHGIRKGVPLILGDFTHDLKPDILWQNTTSGDLGYWLMNGTTFASWVDVGVLSTNLRVAATGDFNSDGQTDILWENTSTGKRIIWLMNGTGFVSSVNLGIVSIDWRIAAGADFDGDGKTDILWENITTGERGVWLMNGTIYSSWVSIGVVPIAWRIAAVGDFNADGHPDLLWENTATGDRYFWLMNGTGLTSAVYFGNLSTDWRIAAVADFNGDEAPDILWENTVTGDRGFYLMNGTTFSSWVYIGSVTTDWRIAP